MNTLTIPPKSRLEWRKLLKGELSHSFENISLQARLNVGRFEVETGRLSEEELLDDIYQLCEKYSIAVQRDCRVIFKCW